MNFVSDSYSIGQNLYHLEWCPKYQHNMFRREKNKKLCEEVLHEVVKRYKIEITEFSVMPDHIHTVVGIPPTMSISKALQLLKGASSREIFKRKTNFRCRYENCTPVRQESTTPTNFPQGLSESRTTGHMKHRHLWRGVCHLYLFLNAKRVVFS